MATRIQSTTVQTTPPTILTLVRDGFIPSSLAATLFGSAVSSSYISETGASIYLISTPSFAIGGGIGGAVARVANNLLEKTNSKWVTTGLSALGGALFGTSIGMGLHATIYNTLAPTAEGHFFILIAANAAVGTALFSVTPWIVGGKIMTALSLGTGAGSLAGMSLSALSLLFGENGISVFNGALTGGSAAFLGLLNYYGTPPQEESLLPLTHK